MIGFPIRHLYIDRRSQPAQTLKNHPGIESLSLHEYHSTSKLGPSIKLLPISLHSKTLPHLHKLFLELEMQRSGVLDLHGLPSWKTAFGV